MIINALSWYILFVLLGWATFPLTYRLFEKLPDRGYALSKTLGLLVGGFLFWFFGSLGVLQNEPGAILLCFVILIAFSIWSGWHKWLELWSWIKKHWRLVLVGEMVFLFGFSFMVLVRACNPSATGTEKPMELAFINAILNSRTFPPHDPWLSGYSISYYHFGYILAAMLAKVTFIKGGIAFNLMLASVFGLSALGAYGIVYDLIISYMHSYSKQINALAWGLLGPVFLLFVSNLEGVLEVLHQAGVGWDLTTLTSRFWEWVNIESLRVPPSTPLTLVPQRFWWWWQASRVLQDIDLLGNISNLSPIDEFPAFSFVLGDLHPHVLVMPFVLLVVGLSFNVFKGGMSKNLSSGRHKFLFRWDLFLVGAISLGGIIFMNTWDFPVYFILFTGTYLAERVAHHGWRGERLAEFFYLAIPLAVASLLLYLPFLVSFQSQAGGILPNLVYPTRGLYLWLMFGPLFVPVFLFMGRLWRIKIKSEWRWGLFLVLIMVVLLYLLSVGLGYKLSQTSTGQEWIITQGETAFGGLIGSALQHRLTFGFGLLTIIFLLVGGLSFLLGVFGKEAGSPVTRGPFPFVLLMIVLGGVMVIVPEFIYLRDNFGARMNTIFKFYYQAWMLWSLPGAFIATLVLKEGKWFSKIALSVVIIASLVYPAFAFPDKTSGFSPVQGYTLDASRFLVDYQPDEAAAIGWLSQAPYGVVAEAVGGQYSGYARVSTLSGQPAVLGWPGHEGQWRGGYEEVGTREQDIRMLYETPNWETALELIIRYNIQYIYIGGLERSTYALNPGKFEQNLEAGFWQNDVIIFVVPEVLKDYPGFPPF